MQWKLQALLMLSQKVHVSMMAGKATPNAARHRAPNSEMKSSRLGMATASRTANRAKQKDPR
jgi:hypothetical protein